MTEEQSQKLADIEAGAQVNVIEHIKVNNVEIPPTNKTVNIEIDNSEQENIIEHIYYDGVEQLPNDQKAVYIVSDPHEDHVNRIESIFVNDTEQVPDQQKAVRLTLNAETLQINTIEGAIVPNGNETEAVTIKNKKLELERIAKTGDVKDLLQTENTYITFDCGSSTDVI